jgi:excisionase family DNA binding protein
MSKQTYTTEEAADLLGVTPGRVRQMIIDGLLETERFGRAHVVTAKAIEAAKQRRTKPGPAPKAPAETTATLNKAFREAKEAEETSTKKVSGAKKKLNKP